jgi:adenine-specific DNA methylase
VAKGLEDFDEDLSDEEKEFFFAASETAELLKTLNLSGISQTAAISGSLTQMLTQLFIGSRTSGQALGILASCLSAASENLDKFEGFLGKEPEDEQIH